MRSTKLYATCYKTYHLVYSYIVLTRAPLPCCPCMSVRAGLLLDIRMQTSLKCASRHALLGRWCIITTRLRTRSLHQALNASHACEFYHSSSSSNNWSLLPLCFTLSLESAPFVSSSTSFWYQFLHLLLTLSYAVAWWLSGRALDLWFTGRGFSSRPIGFRVT